MELSMGTKDIFISESVENSRRKLERSIASNRHIKKGEVIQEDNIHLLSPGDGYRWADRYKVIGRVALVDIPRDEIIYPSLINTDA